MLGCGKPEFRIVRRSGVPADMPEQSREIQSRQNPEALRFDYPPWVVDKTPEVPVHSHGAAWVRCVEFIPETGVRDMEAETSGRPAAAAAERPVGADGYPVGGYGTAEEVAAFLSMSVSGVRKLVRAGRLPSVRLARRVVRLPWVAVRAVVTAAAADAVVSGVS